MNLFLDSFVALLLCSSLFLFTVQPMVFYRELREHELAHDFLQASLKQEALLAEARSFCEGGSSGLDSAFDGLLGELGGSRCLSFRCNGFESKRECSGASRVCSAGFVLTRFGFKEFGVCLVSQQRY